MHLLLTFYEQTDEMYMKLIYYLINLLLLMKFVHLKKNILQKLSISLVKRLQQGNETF